MLCRRTLVAVLAAGAVFTTQSMCFAQSESVDPATAGQASPPPPAATEKVDEKAEPSNLKPGVLSSVGSYRKTASTDQSLDGSAPGSEASPVTGSIRHSGQGDCEALLSNAGKNAYSVSFEVVTVERNGGFGRKRSFSATVPAGKTVTRSVSCEKGENIQVVLKSGKRLK